MIDVHLPSDGGVPQSQGRNDGGIEGEYSVVDQLQGATAVKSLVTEAVSKRVVKRFGVFQERLA